MEPRAQLNVFKGEDGRYWWNVQAENGELVCRSTEGYAREADAFRGFRDAWNVIVQMIDLDGTAVGFPATKKEATTNG